VVRKRRPHVATPDEVRIRREGDFAIIEYLDASIETTQYRVGAETLSRMTDEDILTLWNAGLATHIEEPGRSRRDMSGLLKEGRLVARIEAMPLAPNQPFLNVQGRLFTPMELCAMLGAHAGSDVAIELSKSKTEDG
jgi:hypothetical protein